MSTKAQLEALVAQLRDDVAAMQTLIDEERATHEAHLELARTEYRKLRAQLIATKPIAREATTTQTFFTKADGSQWVKARTGNTAVTRRVETAE